MSLTTDILSTVFMTSGVVQTVTAFQQVENAQRKLDEAQSKASAAKPSQRAAALKALDEAQIASAQLTERLNARMATFVISEWRQIVQAIDEGIQKYTEFGQSAMNLRDIMGVSGAQAAQMETLFHAAGISDKQAMRDILRMSRDTQTAPGQAAFKKLGVDPHGTNSGLALFNEVADKLSTMKDGVEKAALMQHIFGVRGVDALLPLLRMTYEYREQLLGLSSMTDDHIQTIQKWQLANALLGATFEQKIVFPIMSAVLPALVALVGAITWVVDTFGKINQATHGWYGMVVVLSLLAAGITIVIARLGLMTIATWALNAALAVKAALSGPAGWAALAVAGTVVGGFAIGAMMNKSHPHTTAQDANTKALKDNTEAVSDMKDTWNSLNAGGIPKGLNSYDVQQIARQMSLGAIG